MSTDPHQPPAGTPGAGSAPVPGPPSPGQAPPRPAPGLAFFNRIRAQGIVRREERKLLAGVCTGISQRYGVDLLLVRGVFVVLAIVSGFGLGLYGLAWLLLPHPDGRIHAEGALHGAFTAGFFGSVALVLIDLGNGIGRTWAPFWADGWGPPRPVIPWILILLVIWGVVAHRNRRHADAAERSPGGDPPYAGTPSLPSGDSPGEPPYGSPPPSPRTGVATTAPPPPRLDLHAPSHALTLAVLGLALVGAAVTVLWDRLAGPLPAYSGLVAFGVALAIVALGVIVAGLLGRRAGGLAPIAVVLAVLSIGGAIGHKADSSLDTTSWRPVSANAAETGFSLGAGDATLDLTDPGLVSGHSASSPLSFPVQIGVGRVRIVVPDTTAVEVDASLGAGNIIDTVNSHRTASSGRTEGPGLRRVVHVHGNDPVIIVRTNVGLGSIEIVPQEQAVTQ